MPGYDMVLTTTRTPGVDPFVVRVAAVTEQRARKVAETRYGAKVLSLTGLAYCPMCNGFAGLDEPRRHHQIPGCPGRWELPD